MTDAISHVISQLSPTQEHFLKKYLLEHRLSQELQLLKDPECCSYFGPPFSDQDSPTTPLLAYFYQTFLVSFPFITNNSEKDQESFWRDTVQPFVRRFNRPGHQKREHVSKRTQVNKKLLSGLLLFFNSVVVTEKDMDYLSSRRLKPSDTAKVDMIRGHAKKNDLRIDVVCVRTTSATSWNPFTNKHHYEFVIEVGEEKGKAKKPIEGEPIEGEPIKGEPIGQKEVDHFVCRAYHEFHALETRLKKLFPVLSTDGPRLPKKVRESEDDLPKEKLRLSLRGYLRALVGIPEIAHSEELREFLNNDSFESLTAQDLADRRKRMEHDRVRLATQIEFQKHTAQVMLQLSEDFDKFKKELVMNPNTVTRIVREIGETPHISQLSPLLRTFNEWSKLEVAATLHQVFLGQDNSNEWFLKCKKFHKFFPYSIVNGILQFTNPVKIVSRIIDLLLVNVTFWSGHPHNLLSMIFITLLDDDLSDFAQELDSLKNDRIDERYAPLMARIEEYVLLDEETTELIKREVHDDLLMNIFNTSLISPPVPDHLFSEVLESYHSFESISQNKDVAGAELYSDLRQYWRIIVRKKDKDFLKELWQEPELTHLIKKFLTIFYQPLMRILSKSDIHIVFRSFQHFMDDLMSVLTQLNGEDSYFLSSIEVFDRLKALLDRHESVLWSFIHNVHKNDDQKLFIKLVEWIETFLALIRLKFVDKEKVLMRLENAPGYTNADLFIKQLDARSNRILAKRKLFKEYLESKASSDDSEQARVDRSWEEMNEGVFNGEVGDLGLDDDDLEEFNNMAAEDDLGGSEADRRLREELRRLDRECEEYGTSELDGLDGFVREEMIRIFNIERRVLQHRTK